MWHSLFLCHLGPSLLLPGGQTGRQGQTAAPEPSEGHSGALTKSLGFLRRQQGFEPSAGAGRKFCRVQGHSRAGEMLPLPLPLLLHDLSDPGQVVGDAGVDPGWGMVAKGNNSLCHVMAHQGPTRISLGREEVDFRGNRFFFLPVVSDLLPPCPGAPFLPDLEELG